MTQVFCISAPHKPQPDAVRLGNSNPLFPLCRLFAAKFSFASGIEPFIARHGLNQALLF